LEKFAPRHIADRARRALAESPGQVAQALWGLNHDPGSIIPTLLDLTKPNVKRRQMPMDYGGQRAMELLGKIGPRAEAAVPRLKEIIQENKKIGLMLAI
jgi:hypothetical protein